jgi:coenzyme F420-reducing hydrogenase beta subunit
MTDLPEPFENISLLPKNECFGCSACVDICPADCIEMTTDEEGFYYPQVDNSLCIDCGACIEVCPGFNDVKREDHLQRPIFYGGYIHDEPIRLQSSSGGVFTLVAEHILALGGVVYGAIYDFTEMKVTHARATTKQELAFMRGSKYVQSDSTGMFLKVKKDLQAGIPVMVTGTPCQIAGLYLFLGKEYDNLTTCDLVCHGVPSPGLFTSHFSAIEDRHKSPITGINFRTKARGWGNFLNFFIEIETDTKKQLTYAPLDAYYAVFLSNLALRPVCYQCKYATTHRDADLTLGDFWGVNKEIPELSDGKGTSLISVNTQKGEALLQQLQPKTTLTPVENLRHIPPNMKRPTPRPKGRSKFFERIHLRNWKRHQIKAHLIAIYTIVKTKFANGLHKIIGGGD